MNDAIQVDPPQETGDQRRLAVVGLPRRFIAEALAGHVVFEGIPDGSEIVNVGHDFHHDGIVLMLRHDSFGVVSLGEMAPMLPGIVVRAIEPSEQKPTPFRFREFL